MNGLRPPCDCCGPLHAFSKPSEGFGKKMFSQEENTMQKTKPQDV